MILSENLIKNNNFDIIVWSAAVSDYKVEGTYVLDTKETEQIQHTVYVPLTNKSYSYVTEPVTTHTFNKVDASKKISSTEKELYLKLVPTEKIVDKIRNPWGFKGILIKFKLQVGISESELIDIATKSMNDSKADFIVANCLEWAKEKAFIISTKSSNSFNGIACVSRDNLPKELFNSIKNRE